MCDHKVGSWKLNGSKLGVLVSGKTHGKLVPWGGEEQCNWGKLCALTYSLHACSLRPFLPGAITEKKYILESGRVRNEREVEYPRQTEKWSVYFSEDTELTPGP